MDWCLNGIVDKCIFKYLRPGGGRAPQASASPGSAPVQNSFSWAIPLRLCVSETIAFELYDFGWSSSGYQCHPLCYNPASLSSLASSAGGRLMAPNYKLNQSTSLVSQPAEQTFSASVVAFSAVCEFSRRTTAEGQCFTLYNLDVIV